MLIVDERQLQLVVDAYRAPDNCEWPHRSCDLQAPGSRGDPVSTRAGEVRRGKRLDGLRSEYYRAVVAA